MPSNTPSSRLQSRPLSTSPSVPSHTSSPLMPAAPSSALSRLLNLLDVNKPSQTADALDQIRRALPTLSPSVSPLVSSSLANLLEAAPGNLMLSHRAVAILAHPALHPRGSLVERPVIQSMHRLLMSAAFQHTALAALQNNATTISPDRDAIITAVTTAMTTHSINSGLLLRGADLLAFHLTQRSPPPHTSSIRSAAAVISAAGHHLCATTSGASTTLLALLAAARHISSLPFPAPRFSRASSAIIDDYHFASTVALAMSRYTASVPVQMHACELIRVATAPTTAIARHAAREFYTAGCANTVVLALQHHCSDREVVGRALTALRAMLLGGGFHGRALKPGLHLDPDFAELVASTSHKVSLAIAAKDRDLSSAAIVLAMDIRAAATPKINDPSLTQMGKRIIRRIRFGHKLNFYQADDACADSLNQPNKFEKLFNTTCTPSTTNRTSFASRQVTRTRTAAERLTPHDSGDRSKAAHEFTKLPRKKPEEEPQMALNRRWRSVSATTSKRAGSIDRAARTRTFGKAERKSPLVLTGSDMPDLTRQQTNVFTNIPTHASRPDGRLVSMDHHRVSSDTERFRRPFKAQMGVRETT